ncbi:hypothetical protein EC957_002251 [Mortierella hygrophila]|uniref:Peptidase C19 ubiquitin carboxyl-terminal hydrolase domain-containing protein n=1 Tax=Mortierella hygrophila TaxID=979708 RepID=A0A9P6F4F2_9FUNG|nr:hypothetical protein EC957_002251 [Mortierella hygrophila]
MRPAKTQHEARKDTANSMLEDVFVVETAKGETCPGTPESGDNESDDTDDKELLGEEQKDSLGITIPKKVKKVESKAVGSKKPAEEPKHIFRRAFKRYLISSLPPTLVLHLKRFESSGRFGQMRKIEDHVDIPVEIDMAPYFVPKNEIEEEEENENESETGLEARKEEEANGVQVQEWQRRRRSQQKKSSPRVPSESTSLELPDIRLAVMLAQDKENAEERKQDLAVVDKVASSSSLATGAKIEEESKREVPAFHVRQEMGLCQGLTVSL